MSEHPNVAVIRSAYGAVENGDMEGFASAMDEDVVWHESTPGLEGTYHGRDAVLAMMGRLFETGLELTRLSLDHVLADDTHAVVLVEMDATMGARRHTGRYVDVYRVQDGKLAEHWHLSFDHAAETAFFATGA